MKKAEEWKQTPAFQRQHVDAADIREIQLDAIKEGMRRAAEMKYDMPAYMWVNVLSWHDIGNRDQEQRKNFIKLVQENRDKHKQAILTAAEQLTEKDL